MAKAPIRKTIRKTQWTARTCWALTEIPRLKELNTSRKSSSKGIKRKPAISPLGKREYP